MKNETLAKIEALPADTIVDVHPFTESGNGPGPYRFLDMVDSRPTDPMPGELENLDRIRKATGCKGTCQHCGTPIRYYCVIENEEGVNFVVGSDCVEKTGDFGIMRAAAAAKREKDRRVRAANKARKAAARREAFAKERKESPKLLFGKNKGKTAAELVETEQGYARWILETDAFEDMTRFRADLAATDFAKALEAEKAEAAAKEATRPNLTDGRQEFTGRIVGFKHASFYTARREVFTLKMIVELEDGNKVYSTVPAAIADADKGDTVKFTATLEVSRDDNHFGFCKRPSKATILS